MKPKPYTYEPHPNATAYRVARLGQSAWHTCASITEAAREQEIANRTCAPGHVVIAVTDEGAEILEPVWDEVQA